MASSSRSNIFDSRQWMYRRIDPESQSVSKEFIEGVTQFMTMATNQQVYKETGTLVCPCVKCKNEKFVNERTVWKHLYLRGFTPNYFMWLCHGEKFAPRPSNVVENFSRGTIHHDEFESSQDVEMNPYVEMVQNVFRERNENIEEDPNEEAKSFFEMLESARNPLYDGCRSGLSQLSLSARLMNLKTENNLSENCMDSILQLVRDYLPEDNNAVDSYYETKKMMRSLGLLPYQKIDVCQDNCMIFWRETSEMSNCLFCGKDRFYLTKNGKSVPYRRMWYLPITDRLKRLYQSVETASDMRWHAEHSSHEGEMCHPSDGEAWKHFNKVYPDFAAESRNVYLGLCTDGFNPFGMSEKNYSL